MAKITVAQLAAQLEELAAQNAKLQAELESVKSSKGGRSRLSPEEKTAKKAEKDAQRATIKAEAATKASDVPRIQGMYFRPPRPGMKGRVWVKGTEAPPSPCVVTCFSQADGSLREYYVEGEWELTKKKTGYTQQGAVRIDDATEAPAPAPTSESTEDFLRSLG